MFLKFLTKYSVLIEGENLFMDLQGVQRFGFFTTRYVEAADVESASKRAIALVGKELLAQGCLLNEHGDNPAYTVGEILQIDSFNGVNVPGKGFTFYPMGS
jgi:hypothetical protein